MVHEVAEEMRNAEAQRQVFVTKGYTSVDRKQCIQGCDRLLKSQDQRERLVISSIINSPMNSESAPRRGGCTMEADKVSRFSRYCGTRPSASDSGRAMQNDVGLPLPHCPGSWAAGVRWWCSGK